MDKTINKLKIQNIFLNRNITFNQQLIFKLDYYLNYHITNRDVCTTINLTESKRVFHRKLSSMNNQKDLILSIIMDKHDYKIYFHENQLKNQYIEYSAYLSNADKTSVDLGYSKCIFKRLLYPYISNCFDYNIIGFKDRSHALDQCYSRLFMKKYNSTCCGSVIEFNHNYLINFTESSKSDKIKILCNEKFKNPDCNQNIIQIISFDMMRMIRNKKVINIYASPDVEYNINQHPRIPLYVYLTSMGSIINFWLGVIILQISDLLMIISKKACKSMEKILSE